MSNPISADHISNTTSTAHHMAPSTPNYSASLPSFVLLPRQVLEEVWLIIRIIRDLYYAKPEADEDVDALVRSIGCLGEVLAKLGIAAENGDWKSNGDFENVSVALKKVTDCYRQLIEGTPSDRDFDALWQAGQELAKATGEVPRKPLLEALFGEPMAPRFGLPSAMVIHPGRKAPGRPAMYADAIEKARLLLALDPAPRLKDVWDKVRSLCPKGKTMEQFKSALKRATKKGSK